MQASSISVGCVDHEAFEQKLAILRSNKDSCERKLDVLQSVAAFSRERAIKGENIYQDMEEEQMRAELDLQILQRQIVEIKRHTAAVEEQCIQMKNGGGFSLWPKPVLHPSTVNDGYVNHSTLELHPCVFCNRGYPYYDIVIASCRHIYHIFCAAALARVDNRCTKCNEVFHPHWWQSFGFRGACSGFEDETMRLELATNLKELKQSLKENGSRHVLNCKYQHCMISLLLYCSSFNVLVFLSLFMMTLSNRLEDYSVEPLMPIASKCFQINSFYKWFAESAHVFLLLHMFFTAYKQVITT